ncbi:MAG: C69 family dipeptidase, partial [Bacteroidales bacterium]|nr:C69 family dipeptidase [Bacteroidales bacterium]
IQIIAQLTDEYGYYSSGESFSISDPNEVWIMEMIGKGPVVLKDKDIKKLKETGAKFPYNKGALWVAIRIPDGYISGHANQARITTFPLNDPQNCLYSKDVISFARERGFFKASKDEEFSFADTYCPLDYGSIRFCDARVWCGFLRVNSSMTKYEKYITMGDVSARMPLYIKPDRKLTIADVISLMRDHYEGTPLDMSKDLGGGPFNSPYRWRPMTWKVDNVDYCHERAVSTQQTGFSFVAQSRGWLPSQIGGIIWFSVDDSYSTVYVPMYCGMIRVPQSYAEGNGSLLEFSWDAAFWVFNFVSNFAYTRYSDMIKDIQKTQSELENYFFTSVPMIDKAAADLYKTNPEAAREYITNFSVNQGDMTVAKWRKLGEYLFVKYMDGNIKIEKDGKFQKNGYTQAAQPLHPEYPEKWYRAIIKDNGDALKMKKLQNEDSH